MMCKKILQVKDTIGQSYKKFVLKLKIHRMFLLEMLYLTLKIDQVGKIHLKFNIHYIARIYLQQLNYKIYIIIK